MITQQVAAYLIKKMDAAVKSLNSKVVDKTDELFKYYLASKSKKAPADVISDELVNNEAIVEAFRWRAADLVSTSNKIGIYNLTVFLELSSVLRKGC
jgi:acyl-CoA oxidase